MQKFSLKKINHLIGISMLTACISMGNTVYANAAVTAERTEQYQYGVGSISKTFMAVAIMKLQEEGKLSLDEPVVTYLPEFTMADERYKEITVRMLLDHSAGFKGAIYGNGMTFEEGNSAYHDRLLENLKTQTLKADPGSYSVYSNDGFVLAELVVERITGMSVSDYMAEAIFEPLSMENTSTPFSRPAVSINEAANYLDGTRRLPFEAPTEVGTGGVRSTTEDLCRLSEIFFEDGNGFLSKASINEMMKNSYAESSLLKTDGEWGSSFGLGFDHTNIDIFDSYGIKAVSKGGDLDFQHGNLTILPEQNMSCAVLSSGGNSLFNIMVSNAVLEAALEAEGVTEPASNGDYLTRMSESFAEEKTAVIPDEIREKAGMYCGGCFFEVAFPDDSTMQLTIFEKDKETVQSYRYAEDGWFYGTTGQFIGAEQYTAGDGVNGISKIKYDRAEDEDYLLYETCMTGAGLGTVTLSDVMGKKVEPKTLTNEAAKAWEERYGTKYYISSEEYLSTAFDTTGTIRVKIEQAPAEGFLKKSGCMSAQEILDENNSTCTLLQRDQNSCHFYMENGKEMLNIPETDITYESEKSISDIPTEDFTETIQKENQIIWYQIPENSEGRQIDVAVSGEAAVYVYGAYDNCTYSTIEKDAGSITVLPKDGKLAFAGRKGAELQVSFQ